MIGCLMLYGLTTLENHNLVRCGYLFNDAFWGRDYAFEMIKYLLDYLANLGTVASIEGGVETKNRASVKVLYQFC